MTTTTAQDQYLIFKVEDFCQRLKNKDFKHPVDRAKALEALADLAWDDVEDLYQSTVRIDP